MELYIVVVNLLAGTWLLAKLGFAGWTIGSAWSRPDSAWKRPFAVLFDPDVWAHLILLAIDLGMSAVVYGFYALTVSGRTSGAISATMALFISIGLVVFSWIGRQEKAEAAHA